MNFENVCIESLGYALGPNVWSSASIEEQLAPLYERLKLPEGRLELMTGIRERRFWDSNTLYLKPALLRARMFSASLQSQQTKLIY